MFYKLIKNIFIISIFIRVILIVLAASFDLYIVGMITTKIINFIILFSALFLLYKIKNKTERNTIILVFYPIIIILIIINSFITIFCIDNQEYIFSSPNKKNAIILDENIFWNSTHYNIYQRKGFIFKKDLSKDISTDDRQPFANNNYSISWEDENTVTISYSYFSGTQHSSQITLTLK